MAYHFHTYQCADLDDVLY